MSLRGYALWCNITKENENVRKQNAKHVTGGDGDLEERTTVREAKAVNKSEVTKRMDL